MTTKKYQYGSDPSHIVELTESQALAVNDIVFFPDVEGDIYGPGLVQGTLRIPDGCTLEDYHKASAYLNQYIQDHGGSIPCSEEYLETHKILTLIED